MIEQPKDLVLLLREDRSSRAMILARFLENPETGHQLVKLACTIDSYPIQEYSSWLLAHATEQKKAFIQPHQAEVIDAFIRSSDQTVLRNLCNVLYKLPLIDYKESELLECLMVRLRDESNKIALHVYALYKLVQFIKKYPDLKREIDELITLKSERDLPPSFSAAIRHYNKSLRSVR